MQKEEVVRYLDSLSILLVGVFFAAFPVLFSSLTTDGFILPKQILLGVIVGVLLLVWGIKMVLEKTVKIRKTPFDLPVFLLGVFAIASTYFSINRNDSLAAVVPFVLALVAYFLVANAVRNAGGVLFVISSLILSASLISLNTILSFFKLYALPFEYAKVQTFSPVGSYLDQALVLAIILPIAAYFAAPLLKVKYFRSIHPTTFLFGLATVVISVGLAVNVYGLFTQFKPLILPFETGFQTAFAAISQDIGRNLQAFLLGSGYGTYGVDFARFKQVTFNSHADLWSLQFIRSSSFVLELLATTGILGLGSFIYLLLTFVKNTSAGKRTNPLYVSLFLAFVIAFVLPLSFVSTALLFLLLGLFSATQGYSDVKFQFAAFGDVLSGESPVTQAHGKPNVILPVLILVLFAGVIAAVGYQAYKFIQSDILFQNSLVALSQQNAGAGYELQRQAIGIYPERDFYHRSFSQINLALANNLASKQPKDASPSAEVQQNIYALIQQSINAARSATAVSPQSAVNWQNLSSIYTSLIGFGENAEQFAILTQQQAIALDPTNPNEYIILGGLYLRLKAYDAAIDQFGRAVQLKPDYANAYYNLGHAYEAKGDLIQARNQYLVVKQLTVSDKDSQKKITEEIDALQKKIGSSGQNAGQTNPAAQQNPAQNQPELEVSQPTTQLPERDPKVALPAPATATASAR